MNKNGWVNQWQNELDFILTKNEIICIAIITMQGELLYSNKAIRKLLQGDNVDKILNPNFSDLSKKVSTMPNGEVFNGEITFGDYSTLNTSIHSIIYKKGNELLLLGGVDYLLLQNQNQKLLSINRKVIDLQRQISNEKRNLENANEIINQSNEQLQRLNAGKDKFISILAHDLRNPFLSLVGISQILSESIKNNELDDLQELADSIYSTSKNTFSMLEELLTWSLATSGNFPFKPDKINLYEICENVIETCRLSAHNKDISINNLTPREQIVYADKNMLKTIVRNLISNAIKYSFKHSEIDILYTKDTADTITIKDYGTGMSNDAVENLFKLSNKKSKPGTSGEKGSGLGLLLCSEFINSHGGKIWAESELGKGTQFIISLPID